MIKMVRVDERLVHGQVALVWSKELGIDRIVVVNEKAAADKTMTATVKLATPKSVKTIVVGYDRAKKLFADPRFDEGRVFVVVDSPKDALFVVENASNIDKVNVGNFGRADKSVERERFNDNVFLCDEDRDALKEIISRGIQTEYQLVPNQPVTDLGGVL